MAASSEKLAALRDIVVLRLDEYNRAIQCEDRQPGSVSVIDIEDARIAWDEAVVNLENALHAGDAGMGSSN